MGPAKSSGLPHLPAGIRSDIWRKRTGSASKREFLEEFIRNYISSMITETENVEKEKRQTHMSVSI